MQGRVCTKEGYQVSLVVSGSSSRSDDWCSKPAPTTGGHLRSSYRYRRFMRCSYSSASGGFGLLVPSDWAVMCSAKPLRSDPLADFFKRYINKLILLSYAHLFSHMTHDLLKKIVVD